MNLTLDALPHSREAEEAMLGAVLINPEAYFDAADFLQAEDFYQTRHQHIWRAFTRLHETRVPLDLLTVSEELDRHGQLVEAGGAAYLTALIHQTPSSLNAEAYGRIVRGHATRRKLLGALSKMAVWAYDEALEVDDLSSRCAEELSRALSESVGVGLTHIAAPLSEMYDRMSEAARAQVVPGVPTGIESVDHLIGNLKPGLVIVAARPGQGKTTLKHTVAINAARKGFRVAVFSLEMSAVEVSQRFTSNTSEVDLSLIHNALLDENEWGKINGSVETLEKLPLYVDDTPELTTAQIEARCRKLEMTVGKIDLVVVDYLQLVAPPFKASEGNRAAAVGAVAKGLRVLARKLGVPVLAGAQLNRETEKEKRKPRLSDLRESGDIEAEAHLVMFPYEDEDQHTYEMIIAKHRNGPTGSAPVLYRKSITKFEDV